MKTGDRVRILSCADAPELAGYFGTVVQVDGDGTTMVRVEGWEGGHHDTNDHWWFVATELEVEN